MAPLSIPRLTVFVLAILAGPLSGAGLTLTHLFPADGASTACVDTPLRLTFNQPAAFHHQGGIVVYRARDNAVADSFDLSRDFFTNSFGGKTLRYHPFEAAGNVASVHLHAQTLQPGEEYIVKIDSAAFGLSSNVIWRFATRPALEPGKTNLVVAADGTGNFCTVQGAIDYVPDDNQAPIEILVRKGIYEGITYLPPQKPHLDIKGEGRNDTVLAGFNNDRLNPGRLGRALFSADAGDLVMENLALRNTTPPGGSQAEALAVNSDHCLLRSDDFYSVQDTLLLNGRVYLTNCYAEGDVDFVWGRGAAFFDQCELRAIRNGYYLQARNSSDGPGYVFFRCKLSAAPGVSRCFLARINADRFPYSSASFIRCQLGEQVPPIGWEIKGTNTSHLRFGEYQDTDLQGNRVDVTGRHPASRQLAGGEAAALSRWTKVLSLPDSSW